MRNTNKVGIVIGLILVVIFLTTATEAKVARIKLQKLISESDIIAVAKIDGLLSYDGLVVARAVPIQVLKGDPKVSMLHFVAGGTWTCDISTAVRGETALLFLSMATSDRVDRKMIRQPTARVTVKPFYFIGHSGRGRMPIRAIDGVSYVTVWTGDVQLPETINTVPGPDSRILGSIRSVALADIVDAVQKTLAGR